MRWRVQGLGPLLVSEWEMYSSVQMEEELHHCKISRMHWYQAKDLLFFKSSVEQTDLSSLCKDKQTTNHTLQYSIVTTKNSQQRKGAWLIVSGSIFDLSTSSYLSVRHLFPSYALLHTYSELILGRTHFPNLMSAPLSAAKPKHSTHLFTVIHMTHTNSDTLSIKFIPIRWISFWISAASYEWIRSHWYYY